MPTHEQLIAEAAAAKRQGRIKEAETNLVEAVRLLRERTQKVELAAALRELGELQRLLPDSDGGVAAYEEAVSIFRGEGEHRRVAHALRHLADIKRTLSEGREAVRLSEDALEIYARYGAESDLETANTLRSAALAQEAVGGAEQARRRWTEAERLYISVGVEDGIKEARAHVAKLRE